MKHAAVLLFDRDCGFCRWSAARIVAWDRRRRIRPVALQSPEADWLLGSMEPKDRMASWHLVSAGGRIHSAGAAVAPLMRLLPGGSPIATAAEALPRVTDRTYRWVARHRGQLGRLVGSRACRVDPSHPSRSRPA